MGEQQKLGFARLLHARPRYAILDEATSALDLKQEEACMELVASEKIGMLTIAHRLSVVRFHQRIATMDVNGAFSVSPLEPSFPTGAPTSEATSTLTRSSPPQIG